MGLRFRRQDTGESDVIGDLGDTFAGLEIDNTGGMACSGYVSVELMSFSVDEVSHGERRYRDRVDRGSTARPSYRTS